MQSFREVLHDCALMDIDSKGCAFTWMNYREGNDLVKDRLDRVLCNWTWRIAFSEAKVCALPAVGSDHSLLVLSTDAKMHIKWKTFYFEAYWLQHQNCQGVIDTAWSSARAKGANKPRQREASDCWRRRRRPRTQISFDRSSPSPPLAAHGTLSLP